MAASLDTVYNSKNDALGRIALAERSPEMAVNFWAGKTVGLLLLDVTL